MLVSQGGSSGVHGSSAAQHLVHPRHGGAHECGSSHPFSARGSIREQRCCPVSPVLAPGSSRAAEHFLVAQFSQQLTQEANRGRTGRFSGSTYQRLTGSLWAVEAVGQCDCDCSFLPLLLLSSKALALGGPAKAGVQSSNSENVFSCVSSPLPSPPSLC